ncbi:MAG: DUF2461 domain-containing protein [Acidobacteria bacterium]|nr:DUF2461 domain-containing protein [Acidobacteriota bacterium]
MPTAFPGFPSEAMTFFRGLARNNTREWFQPRKAIYDESVKAPMIELVHALNRALARLAPAYISEPEKAIYRLYRDTRFSPDKTPYKTHIAAIFPRRGFEKHTCAGLYFSVSPKEVEIAGGVYMPGAGELQALRTHLAEHHARFRKLIRSRGLVTLLGEMQGDRLARVPKGFCSEHPAADLVRYKQWLWFVSLAPDIVTTPRLYDEVFHRFRAMLPVVDFLNEPLLAARKKPAGEVFFV